MPGDTIEYHMTKIARRKMMWWYRGEAKVAGEVVAEAEVGAMIAGSVSPCMAAIDPTARIAPGAVVGSGVEVGPYCVIGPDVVIGDNCRLVAHVHVAGHTHYRRRHGDPAVCVARHAAAIGQLSRRADAADRSAPAATSAKASP